MRQLHGLLPHGYELNHCLIFLISRRMPSIALNDEQEKYYKLNTTVIGPTRDGGFLQQHLHSFWQAPKTNAVATPVFAPVRLGCGQGSARLSWRVRESIKRAGA
ncbi:hypothetical protein [Sphingomonas caeni]|uniref:hypothetical protein n=1 Tax=Sphingomonas caeni TaxID=2984949 RepID=UPI00222FBFDD|nr:hypothetical protein [Sphingomonas caeni]